jgi:hypothetical protein
VAVDKVYYHELAHGLMDTAGLLPDPYGESWGRVVEESLANLVAFRRFQGQEALWVAALIREQPPEYRGYAAASTHLFPFHQGLPPLPFWHPFFREVWEDYLRWLKRRGFSLRYSPSFSCPPPRTPGSSTSSPGGRPSGSAFGRTPRRLGPGGPSPGSSWRRP